MQPALADEEQIDEDGEDCLFPAELFALVDFVPTVEKKLLAIAHAA